MEICEAVKIKVEPHSNHTIEQHQEAEKTLVFLAQEYLAIKGMPEEKFIDHKISCMANADYEFNWGFNQSLHLCKLAMIKAVPSEEELAMVIFDKEIDGFEGGSLEYISKELANTLYKLYLEKLGVKK